MQYMHAQTQVDKHRHARTVTGRQTNARTHIHRYTGKYAHAQATACTHACRSPVSAPDRASAVSHFVKLDLLERVQRRCFLFFVPSLQVK